MAEPDSLVLVVPVAAADGTTSLVCCSENTIHLGFALVFGSSAADHGVVTPLGSAWVDDLVDTSPASLSIVDAAPLGDIRIVHCLVLQRLPVSCSFLHLFRRGRSL